MKKRSHYEPLQSCVQKDLTRKIDDALLKMKSIRDSDPLAGSISSLLDLDLQKVVDQHNNLGARATDLYKDHSLTSALDTIKNLDALALSASQQSTLKIKEVLEPVNQLALLAAPASKNYPSTSALDTIKNLDALALSASQQFTLKIKEVLEPVNQLALLAAPASQIYSLPSAFDSIQNSCQSAFSASHQAVLKAQEKFEAVNQLALLAAPFGYDRSGLSGVDSVVDSATFTGRAAFKFARDLQDIEDYNKSLGMLGAPFGYDCSALSRFDSVVDSATLAGSEVFKMERDFQNMVDRNNHGMLGTPFGYERSVLSGLDSVVDSATLAGNSASKMVRDFQQEMRDQNKSFGKLAASFGYDRSGLPSVDTVTLAGGATFPLHFGMQNILSQSDPYECFREEFQLPPVITLKPCITVDHNWVTHDPKHPLIIKKNCPEEEYNPNQDEMRVRLLEAVDTYLERQSKKIRQTRERLEFCETEELKQKQEGVIQAHDRLVQWAETIERDYLLLTEEELIQQLQENPEIIGYLLEGLQTIKIRKNQLHNEPEFIEKQRIRVAYNHNSFELDDDTDHLLNYEVVRWLDRVRSEGIACNHEPEKKENNAHERAIHQSDATHSTDNTNQKRVPDFKKNRSWTQFVQNKNILEEFEQICDKEGCTTKKQIVDEFWIVYGNELGGKKSGLYDACCNTEKASKFLEQVISKHKKAK